jgi:type IV fimbrial biogenesis protein FimT
MVSKLSIGFTLIETLVSLVIISIIVAMSVPNFSHLWSRSQIDTVVDEFSNALYLARSEAIKRAASVTLCASRDGSSCAEIKNSWHQGWLIFVDSDADTQIDLEGSIIRIYQTNNSQLTLIGNRYLTKKITFLATGRITVLGGTIQVCSKDNSQKGKNIVLIATGRFRIDTDISCE